jgi:hypothetical protein
MNPSAGPPRLRGGVRQRSGAGAPWHCPRVTGCGRTQVAAAQSVHARPHPGPLPRGEGAGHAAKRLHTRRAPLQHSLGSPRQLGGWRLPGLARFPLSSGERVRVRAGQLHTFCRGQLQPPGRPRPPAQNRVGGSVQMRRSGAKLPLSCGRHLAKTGTRAQARPAAESGPRPLRGVSEWGIPGGGIALHGAGIRNPGSSEVCTPISCAGCGWPCSPRSAKDSAGRGSPMR